MKEHKIEEMILRLVRSETKMVKAVMDGRGANSHVTEQERALKKLAKELNLDYEYLEKEIQM